MATINGFRRTATKHGQIITKPTSMGTNVGPYFSSVIKGSDVPGWPSSTWHTLLYFSTDHDSPSNPTTGGAGGIWLYCCSGDPTVAANWQSWDDINGNAEFSYMFTATPSTPTTNPIYRDTVAGDQTETPHVKNIGGTLYMHYHNDDNNTYDGFDVQNTVRATSSDGVNYTRQGINITYDPKFTVGIGHTGYMQGTDNPFPFIAESYICRTLHGGGGLLTEAGSESCYWVSNDYINWTPYKYYNPAVGRLLDSIPKEGGNTFQYNASRIDTVVQDGPYWRLIGAAALLGVSGGTPTIGRPIEMLIDDDFQIVSEPETLIPLGGTGEFDELAVSTPAFFEYDGVTYGIYEGEDSSNANSLGIATIDTDAHTWTMLDPLNSNKVTVIDEDFSSLISTDPVPSSVTQVGAGGSVDVSPAGGFLRIFSATDTVSALFPDQTVTLSDYSVIDFYFEGLSTQGTQDNRRSFGLYSSQATSGISQNMQLFADSSSSHTALRFTAKGEDAGGVTTQLLTTKFIGWESSWVTSEEESPQARQHLGIRVIPSLNKAYLLVGGTSEISNSVVADEGLDLLDFDYTVPMYMAMRTNNKESGTRWASSVKFRAVGGLNTAEAVPAAPTMTATPGNTLISFSCPVVAGATGYKAFVDGVETDLGATPSGDVTGLTNGQSYSVYMRSYNASGDSEPSTISDVTPVNNIDVSPSVSISATGAFNPAVFAGVDIDIDPSVSVSTSSSFNPAVSIAEDINITPLSVSSTASAFDPVVAISENINVSPELSQSTSSSINPSITVSNTTFVIDSATNITAFALSTNISN